MRFSKSLFVFNYYELYLFYADATGAVFIVNLENEGSIELVLYIGC